MQLKDPREREVNRIKNYCSKLKNILNKLDYLNYY